MKRLHVHVGVNDLDQSIRFYSTLFASEPTVVKDDYAKWMLDDPRVNFAISSGNHAHRASSTSAFKPKAATNSLMFTVGSRRRIGRCSKRALRPAATPSQRKAGFPIPTGSCGKHFSPMARPRSTATAQRSKR